jgi:hypothetical protein
VNGRINAPGDCDVFRFEGRAGEKIIAEIYARRLNSPLDSVLRLTDAAGKELAFNDDHEDRSAGLYTHHADSWLSATLPAAGVYYLHLADVQHKGGPDYAYRLRIGPPRPDFDLRIVPSSINVRLGATVPITVCAVRKDGFDGEITLTLKDAPKGFALSGGRIPAHEDQVRLTLTAGSTPQEAPISLSVEGHATIQGQQVSRPAVPAEDMVQAFAYHHLVPARELNVALIGRYSPKTTPKFLGAPVLKIPAGGTATVRIALPMRQFSGTVQFELSDPPDGIVVKSVSPSDNGAELVLQNDAAKAKPGLQGNLIFVVSTEKAVAKAKGKAQAKQRRVPFATLPALPFEIVER